MFKVLQRKKHYVKPKNNKNKTNYWKFALTDTLNKQINNKINESRLLYKSNHNMDIYNITSLSNVYKILNNIYNKAKSAFKVHISFEYVIINKITGDVTINSSTTKFYFNNPQFIKNKLDMMNMLNKISDHAIKSDLDQSLPNTHSQLIGVYSIGVKIFNLSYLIGTSIILPNYILNSKYIISLDKVENNLSFWANLNVLTACCALMHGFKKDAFIKKMKELLIKYYGKYNTNYNGFDYINELTNFEKTFEFGINIVKYNKDNSISYIHKSSHIDKQQKYNNLCNNHFSYITNINKLAKLYKCDKCGSTFRDNNNFKIHENSNICTSGTKNTFEFKDKILTKPRNNIIEICDYYDISNLDFKYDYIATFDLESVLLKTPNELNNIS